VTPSATPLLTAEAIEGFKAAGIARMAISLDGPDAATHDDFRGIPGTFDRAMFALRHARDIGLDTQLQTTVTRRNMGRLAEVAEIAKEVRTRMWSLFFLIVTGRARRKRRSAGAGIREVFEFMYELSKTAPFGVKTTEAMHYRRYVAQRIKAEHGATENENAKGVAWRTAGVSDGKGFVFVSHTGRDFSQRLPAGERRQRAHDSLTDVYRNSTCSRALRDTASAGQVRHLRIPEDLRRIAVARVCTYRRLPGRRPNCIYQPHLAERHRC
jgi:MoaA/NifB/PqqE/SkfB family radical SAM enzyme